MAELFLARSASDNAKSPVVIKRLLPHMTNDPKFHAMFIDEAKLTSRLAHPNIVTTYEFGEHQDELFIAMEWVDGLDGLALLRECAHRKVRVPTEIAVYIIHHILDALAFAHTQTDDEGEPLGVVHRDISPSNILLSRRGEIKLVDFGIAQATQREHKTTDGTLKGKYSYMSPEQVMDEDIDARSDLFSVGIVLAELLMGRRLFAAPTELDVLLMVRDARIERLGKYGKHLGMDLHRVLRKALQKSRDHRFSTAVEFRDVLSEWLYMHSSDVSPLVIAQIVESLYDDAWKRKRESMEGLATRESPPPGSRAGGRTIADQRMGIPAPIFIDDDDELSEPIEIDGIPVGKIVDESTPIVSIEGLDSERMLRDIEAAQLSDGVVYRALDNVETDRVTHFEQPVERIDHRGATIQVDMNELLKDEGIRDAIVQTAPREDSEARRDPRQFGSIDDAVGALGSSREFDDRQISEVINPRYVPPAPPESSDRAAAAPASEPDDTGNFADSSPLTVLFRLANARATGLLSVSVGGINKKIYFREGLPEYVSSNVGTELFGEYLAAQGVISSGELSMALAMMPHYGGKLGDTLIGLGLLKPLDVFRHLTRQVRAKLVDVCTWTKGTFEWYGGQENQQEAFPLDLNAYEILGAGALEIADAAVIDWLKANLNARVTVVPDSRIAPDAFHMGRLMKDTFEVIDDKRTLTQLRAIYANEGDADRRMRVLYLLEQTGLIALG